MRTMYLYHNQAYSSLGDDYSLNAGTVTGAADIMGGLPTGLPADSETFNPATVAQTLTAPVTVAGTPAATKALAAPQGAAASTFAQKYGIWIAIVLGVLIIGGTMMAAPKKRMKRSLKSPQIVAEEYPI